MRSILFVFASVLSLSATQSFANHDHACSSYAATCKDDPSVTGATDKKTKGRAMGACISAAASADTDAAKGKKCMDAQAKHKGMHGGGKTAPAPTEGN